MVLEMQHYSIAMKTKDGEERVMFMRDIQGRPVHQAAKEFVESAEAEGFKVLWIIPHGSAQ